jgi:hypothetical protein
MLCQGLALLVRRPNVCTFSQPEPACGKASKRRRSHSAASFDNAGAGGLRLAAHRKLNLFEASGGRQLFVAALAKGTTLARAPRLDLSPA